ncbi:hypothetical protein V6246_08860 [Algibacter sp. TI.3.09]|uniref:hypothetical protein n=1 Tax=Algibacter sp. TI.3.09 TaxID=3121298 RepID=UPI003120053C
MNLAAYGLYGVRYNSKKMKTILKHNKKRNAFIIYCILIIIALLSSKYFINNHLLCPHNETAKVLTMIIDKIITSLIVSIIIGIFLFKIEVPDEESKLEIIEPIRISDSFEIGRKKSTFWYFSGGAGRYTRNVTIPKLAKKAGKSNSTINLKICIIDYENDDACKNYVNFKNSLNSNINSDFTWTEDFLKSQILATIFNAIIYKSMYNLIKIDIFLKKTYTTTRIDINDFNCIITKEDKRDFAISSTKDAFLYKTFKEEITQIGNQSKKIEIEQVKDINRKTEIDESLVKRISEEYNFNLNEEYLKELTAILNEKKSIF